jgi:predicted sulfurtransferase
MYHLKNIFFVLLALVPLLAFANPSGLQADNAGAVPEISAEEVKQMLNHPDTVIIDVRQPRNWWRSTTKILSAVREDPHNVTQWIGKFSKDKTLIFYCA